MRWAWSSTSLPLLAALIVAQGALAAGGPVPPVQGSYIGVPSSPYRYAALTAGGNTVVRRQTAGSGSPVSELRLAGSYGIPGVDYTGATTGLSADGRTLVLAALPGSRPPRTTRLIVLDTAPLAVRATLTLAGSSTVDAISPDGRWLYLIHYSASDLSRYEVQAYDLVTRRLLAKPVVDPRDRGEAMIGIPIDRVMSVDRRWAYTLYLRPGGVPFVHALDTVGRRAVCIDLTALRGADIGAAHLVLGGSGTTLRVVIGGVARAAIDTRALAVRRGAGRGHDDVPWALIVLSIAAVGAVAAAGAGAARSRRRRDAAGARREATVLDAQHPDRVGAEDEVPAVS